MAGEKFCGLEEIAQANSLSIETVEEYADRGWFDREEGRSGSFYRGDSIWRCSLISHLRTAFGYSDEEIDGIILHLDTSDIARMGGYPKHEERFVPFEQELAKAGPVWICVGLGEHIPDTPVRFVVHGKIDTEQLDFRVVSFDAVQIYKGKAEPFTLLDKTYAAGVIEPGLPEGSYRIYFGGCASYEFHVTPSACDDYAELILRYFRGVRCGEETEFHPACHLDDGIRLDTGEYHPLVGGWHDAGDMCHIMSTFRAGYYLSKALEVSGPSLACRDELYEEAMHGADFNLRARDAETGKCFTGKGVGGRGGFNGKYIDSFRFTDNLINSGDERHIAADGNVSAMENLSCLAVMSREYNGPSGQFRESCREAAEKGWAFHEPREVRPEQSPVCEVAKRLICCVEWFKTTGDAEWVKRGEKPLSDLLEHLDKDGDFVEQGGRLFEYYQWGGQLLLALALAAGSGTSLSGSAQEGAARAADRIIALSKLHPYGITCFSVIRDEDIPSLTVAGGSVNTWHPLENGKSYRLYQPYTDVYHVHGSVNPVSIIGIGLAVLGRHLNNSEYMDLARRHWEWCIGLNPYQCCMTSSWGACEAAPLSPSVGYMPGGTYTGPVGHLKDDPYFQVGRGMRVGEEPLYHSGGPSALTREVWTTLSAALLYLRMLIE